MKRSDLPLWAIETKKIQLSEFILEASRKLSLAVLQCFVGLHVDWDNLLILFPYVKELMDRFFLPNRITDVPLFNPTAVRITSRVEK